MRLFLVNLNTFFSQTQSSLDTLQETLLCNGNSNSTAVPGAMSHPDMASGIHWETSQCLLTTTRCFTDSLLFN